MKAAGQLGVTEGVIAEARGCVARAGVVGWVGVGVGGSEAEGRAVGKRGRAALVADVT